MWRLLTLSIGLTLIPLHSAAQDTPMPASMPAASSAVLPAAALPVASLFQDRGWKVKEVLAYHDEGVPGPLLMVNLSGYANPSTCTEEAFRAGRCCIVKEAPVYSEVRTADSFLRLAAFAKKRGYSLIINSAFRTDEQQQCLINLHEKGKGAYAAEVGKSNHQVGGRALDIAVHGAIRGFLHRYAPCFGFFRRVKGEYWHFEYYDSQDPHALGQQTQCLKNPRTYQRTHQTAFYATHRETIASDGRRVRRNRHRIARNTKRRHPRQSVAWGARMASPHTPS